MGHSVALDVLQQKCWCLHWIGLFQHFIILLLNVKLKNILHYRVQHDLFKANVYIRISNKELHSSDIVTVING